MLKNYVVTAIRNLARHRSFSIISIVGLGASMAVCLLIIAFIRAQWGNDEYHAAKDRIYHLYSDFKAPSNASNDLYGTSPSDLGVVLKAEAPGVADFVTFRRFSGNAVTESGRFRLNGMRATEAMFRVFDFSFIHGDPLTALAPGSVVLFRTTAEKLFGRTDVVGSTVPVEGREDYLVSAVLEPPEDRSIFSLLDALVLLPEETDAPAWTRSIYSYTNFIMLEAGADPKAVTRLLPDLIDRKYPGDDERRLVAVRAQPLVAMSSGPDMGNTFWLFLPIMVLYLFAGIAVTILVAACFNYVGFSVARSMQRAREVGVRQVVGAARRQIRMQFLTESVVVALTALLFASMLFGWLVEGFNSLWVVRMTLAQVFVEPQDVELIGIFCLFGVLVGLLAGAYPALVISATVPTHVIKGMVALENRRFALRKTLIVTQFVLSFVFVTTAVVMHRQVKHIVESDMGFNQKNLVNVKRFDVPYEVLRNALVQHSAVVEVSGLSILTGTGTRQDVWMNSDRVAKRKKGYLIYTDERTVENLEVRILAGRTFNNGFGSPYRALLNEAAARQLGFEELPDAVGKMITLGEKEMQVIGVVGDFHFYSTLADVRPLALMYDTDEVDYANVRFLPEDRQEVTEHIRQVWEDLGSSDKLDFEFYDEHLSSTSPEMRGWRDIVSLVGTASSFVVLIACLGLLGITAYAMETRKKEIGIRKTLGATTMGLVRSLSSSYLLLVAIGTVVAIPVAISLNRLWLEQIENRIDVSLEPIATGAIALIAIALITVVSQTARAASANPTDVFRQE